MKRKSLIWISIGIVILLILSLLYVFIAARNSISVPSPIPFVQQYATSTTTASTSASSHTSSNSSTPGTTGASGTSSTATPLPTQSAPSGNDVMAWLFPGKTSCTSQAEYSDGRDIEFLKPQYFTISADTGIPTLLTSGCGAYSAANIASVKANSTYQYITVSSGIDGLQALTSNSATESKAIQTLTNFTVTNNVTGIEIDFEDYGSWDAPTYQAYLTFVTELGNALHAQGKKLMIDVPPISNSTEQGYYLLSYKDIAALPVDYVVILSYDYDFDQGAGTPIAPNSWVEGIIKNAKASIPVSKIVMGIPSYAYSGATGSFKITRENYSALESIPGFATAPRDVSSYERIFQYNGKSYVYVDSTALDDKLTLIRSLGIQYVSVWSLGGNPWF